MRPLEIVLAAVLLPYVLQCFRPLAAESLASWSCCRRGALACLPFYGRRVSLADASGLLPGDRTFIV